MESWKVWENIQICRVETPAIMWVKHLDTENQPMHNDFKKLQQQLDIAFNKEKHNPYDTSRKILAVNEPAVVVHRDSWCRSIILEIREMYKSNKQIDVFLVDYGINTTVPANLAVPLEEGMWHSVPYQCKKIRLVNTVPGELSWITPDGTRKHCIRAGKSWSAASLGFIQRLAQSSNYTCKFHPSIPFIYTSNEIVVGNLYIQMTDYIKQTVYGFNYQNEEKIELFENLSDLLVACQVAVLIEEDLTETLTPSKKSTPIDNFRIKGHSQPGNNEINTESPVSNQYRNIRKNILLNKQDEDPDVSEVSWNNPFQMVMSFSPLKKNHPLNNSNNKVSTDIYNLHDIPGESTVYAAIQPEMMCTEYSVINPEMDSSLTGYEKKIRKRAAINKEENMESEINLENSKSNVNKTRLETVSKSMYEFVRPMFDLAKIMRVYNCGKMPVPKEELVHDEADARRIINRSICEVLKEDEFRILPLQVFMWPSVARGRSCINVERRSYGKTFGYLIPLASQIIDMIDVLRKYASVENGPLAIIVCSGWKNANDIQNLLKNLTSFTNVRVAAVYGGMNRTSNEEDKKDMFSLDILITTIPTLSRLGLPLIDSQLPSDESIPGISLKKCSYLVLDDFDDIYEKFSNLTDSLLDKWLNTVHQCETVKQVVVTSKRWNNDVEKISEKLSVMNPNILISSIFEAAIASRVKTRLDCCISNRLVVQTVCDVVSSYSGKKIIVFLDNVSEVERVDELLRTKVIGTIRVTSSDRPVVQTAVNFWTNSSSCVMLVLETAFMEYASSNIKDADIVIHASVPLTSHNLGLRYSYMLNKFEKFERGKAPCVSHFILTPSMISSKPQLIPELERLGIEIVAKVKEAYDEGTSKQKKDRRSNNLCFSFKAFGKCCKQQCSFRHYLRNADEPKLLPSSGQVKLEIIDVISASSFVARIMGYKNKTTNSAIFLEKVYQHAHSTLQDYYSVKENRKCITQYKVGSLCALEKEFWVRGEIIKLNYSEKYVQCVVKMIDERGQELRYINSLYELPDSIKTLPPLAVEVFLSEIKPIDEDTDFTQYGTHLAMTDLLNKNVKIYFMAVVKFALRNTLYVNDLVEIRSITNESKPTNYLARELIHKKIAVMNKSHFNDLTIDEDNCKFEFTPQDDSWLNNYTIFDKSVYNNADNNQLVNTVGETEDGNQSSDGSSTVVNYSLKSNSDSNTTINKSNNSLNNSNSKLQAIISKLRPLQPMKMNISFNSEQLDKSTDNLNKSLRLGPPPPCSSPPRKDYDSDDDEIMSYSNFDFVSCSNKSTVSDISIPSELFNSTYLEINEEIEVEVGEIYSPNKFFVTLFSNSASLCFLEDKIQEGIQRNKFIPFDPDLICNLYIVQFIDGLYYRAKLDSIQPEGTCNASFVDHGEKSVVSWDKIYKCPLGLCEIPPQAIQCGLDIPIPNSEIITVKKSMENHVDSVSKWFIKPSSVKKIDGILHYTVELLNGSEKTPMTQLLIKTSTPKTTKILEHNDGKSERQILRDERIRRLMGDRSEMNSPTETIKDYLNEEMGSVTAEGAINTDNITSTSIKPKPTKIAAYFNRLKLMTGVSPSVSNQRTEFVTDDHNSIGCSSVNDMLNNRQSPDGRNQEIPLPIRMDVRHPKTSWKDCYSMIVLTFDLVGVEYHEFDATVDSINFSTNLTGVTYIFSERLFSNIVSKTASCTVKGREVVVKLTKQSKGSWPRLLSIKGPVPWLRKDIPPIDSSVCSESIKGYIPCDNSTVIKEYGGLPAGISDDDSLVSGATITDNDSELFKFG